MESIVTKTEGLINIDATSILYESYSFR